MNCFFLEKVENLRGRLPLATGDPLNKLREAQRNKKCTFSFMPTNQSDVLKCIKALKNSNATGIDFIDTRSLKLVADLIAPALAHIINLSIELSIFPQCWKWAKVIPL